MTATVIDFEGMRAHLDRVRDEPVEAFPRDEDNRYRIYAIRGNIDSSVVWTAPDPESVGLALCTLAEEGEFEGAAVGVLDTKGAPKGSGVWVVNPYEAGRSR